MESFLKDLGDFLPFYISHGGNGSSVGPVFLRKCQEGGHGHQKVSNA